MSYIINYIESATKLHLTTAILNEDAGSITISCYNKNNINIDARLNLYNEHQSEQAKINAFDFYLANEIKFIDTVDGVEQVIPSYEVMQDKFKEMSYADLDDTYIRYYLNTTPNGTILTWDKTDFAGKIILSYTYLPTMNFTDGNNPLITDMFRDIIIYGVTIRLLRNKLLDAKNELESVNIRSLIADYTRDYMKAKSDYQGYVNKQVETHFIQPFSFLNDTDMNI